MPTTNKPAPVATGTDPGLYNPVTGPVGPLDTAPAPVPPGPGLGVTITTPDIPVVTAQTDTANIANTTTSSFVPNTISTNTVVKYLSVSDESVAVNGQVTNLNFVGTGVSVANNANAINSVTVTIGGGATYGNSNVVSLLAGFGSNTLSTTGNVTGGNLITGAQVVASGVIQSGTGLSTGGYLSVDGGTDLHNTTVTGNLSATGNITGSYVLGNGSQLTGLPATYSNSNVQAYLPTYSGNIGALTVTGNLTVTGTTSTVNTEVVNVSESVVGNIDAGNVRTAGQVSAAGNITGAYFVGNGSALSSLTGANVSGTVANATYALTSNAATYSTQSTTADTANAVAGANVSGTVANATYATSAGSATTATTAGTANAVAGANVSGTVANATYALNSNAATYSTQATYAGTANAVAGANVSGTVANATYATSAGSATTANTVTDAAQANITSVGTLTSLSASGNITTTANVAANYVVLSGGLVSSGASPAPSISGFSTISAVGNITGGNLLTAGLISTSGNITANNLGNISTINLTGSSSNVLYGNGTFAPAAGGAANTGNVTFNDVNIIGTGNLNLQPNGASSDYLNIFLTGSTDIHVAAGNGSSNVILGTDEQANVAVLTTGNVAIQAGNVSGKQTWSFDTAGNLTTPGNLVIAGNTSVFGTNAALIQTTDNRPLLALSSGANGAVSSLWVEDIGNVGTSNIAAVYANPTSGSKIVRIAVGQNGGNTGPNLWDFDATGNLTLPSNAFAVNYANGTAVSLGSGTVTNVQGDGIVSGLSLTGNVTTTGNLTLGGTLDLSSLAGNISTTGNIAGGNVLTGGGITATGNITGGNLLTNSRVVMSPVAYSALAAVSGARAFINDGNLAASGNFGAQVIGGASNVVPVWSDGANWYIG